MRKHTHTHTHTHTDNRGDPAGWCIYRCLGKRQVQNIVSWPSFCMCYFLFFLLPLCLCLLSFHVRTHTRTHTLVNPWLPCCTPVQHYEGIWHRLRLSLEKVQGTHTHTHTHTHTCKHTRKMTVDTSRKGIAWMCVHLHVHLSMCLITVVCMFVFKFCVCVCVFVCVCVCRACRGLSRGDTVLLCIKQAGRQTVCQFFWSWAGLQLVMKWSQHVVKADIYHPLVTAASGIHTHTRTRMRAPARAHAHTHTNTHTLRHTPTLTYYFRWVKISKQNC